MDGSVGEGGGYEKWLSWHRHVRFRNFNTRRPKKKKKKKSVQIFAALHVDEKFARISAALPGDKKIAQVGLHIFAVSQVDEKFAQAQIFAMLHVEKNLSRVHFFAVLTHS